jgi:hypothetical protein
MQRLVQAWLVRAEAHVGKEFLQLLLVEGEKLAGLASTG